MADMWCFCNPHRDGAHPEIKLLRYCWDCRRYICLFCLVENDHTIKCSAPTPEEVEEIRRERPSIYEE